MLTIYLIRHGITRHNLNSVIMGQGDSPLTEEGIRNAMRLAKKLSSIEFDRIYASDLKRAYLTAKAMAQELGIKQKPSKIKALRELDYGIYTGRRKADVKKECPQYLTDVRFVYPNGESFLQMQKRVIKFIKRIEKKHNNKTLLIVSHAGVIRAAECHFRNLSAQKHLKMKITHNYIGKFAINHGKLISYKKYN